MRREADGFFVGMGLGPPGLIAAYGHREGALFLLALVIGGVVTRATARALTRAVWTVGARRCRSAHTPS
jgi:hypothetical protein